MKVLILAGGLGTRLSEETEYKPKPMVTIGDKPILWHIMKLYSHYGINEFVILAGYKSNVIKEYFQNYYLLNSDVTFDLSSNSMEIHKNSSEPWKVTVLDTGVNAMTGGRIKCARPYIGNETFLLTYGDGLTDVNISDVIDFHKKHKKLLTMTAVQPEGRFGLLGIEGNDDISQFEEKPKGDGGWINGGFFVCEPAIVDYIEGESTIFEQATLPQLAKIKELKAFKHSGFWKCMDTNRDRVQLNELWNNNQAQWKKW